MSNNLKEDTLKGVKWSALERFSLQGIQFIISLILARLLSPSDFGTVGMLAIFISISQTFVDGGFSNALIRKIDRTEIDCSTAFYFNIVVGLICYGLLFLLSPYIAIFFNTPILSDLVKVLSISIFINSLTVVQIAKLSIEINFKAQAVATLISVILSGSIGIILAYKGYGVWSLAWQNVLNALFKAFILWYQSKWKPMFAFSVKSFKNLFSYGSKLLTSGLISTIYEHITTIAIGKFYTAKDIGFYSRGEQFAHLPSIAIVDILGRVTFPILSKLQNDDDKLIQVYRKYIQITSMIIFFLLTLLAAIAKPLIILLLTDKWSEAIIFLQIFSFAFMFEHISKLNLNLLQVKGRSDLYLRLEIIKKIIAFSILAVSIPFGVIIICISKMAYSQISLFINTYYTGKLFNLGYMKQLGDFFKYLIFSLIGCTPAFLITLLNLSPIIQLTLGITISTIIYCFLLRKDPLYKEIISYITKSIHHGK